eukprot:CAMPEP_0115710240 /NCGR_PEP_ID=MMETSP0272-20121206/72911_1 /TAXON_ID=71861 /ORGANISM="Scrippsiella trochoidea, Strain CCMP3099" /LENGTH=180 /DNA_ID=CAMNT_0003151927 /DNA_START=1 /DNA_END=539 /DNA_ORIENTATION=+
MMSSSCAVATQEEAKKREEESASWRRDASDASTDVPLPPSPSLLRVPSGVEAAPLAEACRRPAASTNIATVDRHRLWTLTAATAGSPAAAACGAAQRRSSLGCTGVAALALALAGGAAALAHLGLPAELVTLLVGLAEGSVEVAALLPGSVLAAAIALAAVAVVASAQLLLPPAVLAVLV